MLRGAPLHNPSSGKKMFRIIITLCCVAAIAYCPASAQEDSHESVPAVDLPSVFLEPINMSIGSADSTRLDLYVQVPYQTLSFVKTDDVFRASFDVTLELRDSLDVLVTEQLWTDNVVSTRYEETVSRHNGKMSQKTLLLRPALYTFNIQVRDNETQKIARIQRKVRVRAFKQEQLGLSDMILVDKLSQEGDKTVIVPNIAGLIAESPEGFKLFFEAYTATAAESCTFYLSVYAPKGNVVTRDSTRKKLDRGANTCFMNVPGAKLNAGEYRVDVQGVMDGNISRDSSSVISHPFTLRWRGLPTPITDLDVGIEELQYVSDKETIEKMKNAEPTQKRQLFLEFWKKRDPTPNTEANEIMDEYYARVDYANKNFTSFLAGWRTDRGMVYIIFGPPNNIERRPFEMDSKPYEVWTYYEQNREFIFIDQTGFGDYRLQSPLWDIHNRIR